jgi:hypothetical protein
MGNQARQAAKRVIDRINSRTYRIVTPRQYKDGYIEMRGVTPIHHDFILIRKIDDDHYVVREPERKNGQSILRSASGEADDGSREDV